MKVGGDEVIFKMYQFSNFTWEMDKKKAIAPKTEGKGNMKCVFVDEVMGVRGNAIPLDVWASFQEQRKKPFEFDNPAFVEWEYGKSGDAKGQGYWTAEHMNMLMPEFIELFNHCYPGHQMLLNIDWSSNHSAMAPNARTLGNMRVLSGGM